MSWVPDRPERKKVEIIRNAMLCMWWSGRKTCRYGSEWMEFAKVDHRGVGEMSVKAPICQVARFGVVPWVH